MMKPRLRRVAPTTIALFLVSAAVAGAHDLFLKPVRHVVVENADVLVRVLNGTFSKSENSIARSRLLDVSVVSPEGRRASIRPRGAREVTRARSACALARPARKALESPRAEWHCARGKDFNTYLRTDGVPYLLEARRRAGALGNAVRERYARHIKALIQVGTTLTEHFST